MIDEHANGSAANIISAGDGHMAAKPATTFCLIVDDEKGLRNLIARSLRGYMVMTEECGDAHAALEALRLRSYDLIFLDVSLERLENAAERYGDRFEPPAILRRLVTQGRLGQKAGQGFFPWPRPDEGFAEGPVQLETRGAVAIIYAISRRS